MLQGNAGINHPLTASVMCFYEKKRKKKNKKKMHEAFLGKIIDLILS